MSSLDNLTEKIRKDHEEKAAEILSAAKKEADVIAERFKAEGESEREKILLDAKEQAARQEDQIVVGKTLAIRDQNLNAKQETLDKVFAEALTRLNSMKLDEYMKFLLKYLAALNLDGEELVVPAKYAIKSADEINSSLKSSGKKGNLSLTSSDKIEGGFVLRKGGIEQNSTFEALVDYYRYELEGDVIAKLY